MFYYFILISLTEEQIACVCNINYTELSLRHETKLHMKISHSSNEIICAAQTSKN
jgi:hypothetical protein